jgi:hypothetical protein
MSVEICVDLVDESGEQKAFFRAGVAEILTLLGVQAPVIFSESQRQVLLLEDQRQLRASVVNRATGEVWAVRLPVTVDGACECCGGELL